MSLRFIGTGDTIVTCPYTRDYDGYWDLVNWIKTADVRFSNMENPLVDGECPAGQFSGNPWMRAPSTLLDEMADFDFNLYGFANNHALDYHYEGLLQTLKAFKDRNLPVAGAGHDLAEATKHIKVDTPKGSVALVALTTTIDPSAIAGPPRGNILGRPGVSLLRHKAEYYVTEEQLKQLEEIAEVTKVSARLKNRSKYGGVLLNDKALTFGPLDFKVGTPGRMTFPNQYDFDRLEKAVKAAVADADRTVVYIHSHETKAENEFEPDFFVETFSRACVDWGADAVICSGTHQIKAVEIYKGAPIYYSIANLFFRPYDCEYYPEEWYEQYNLDKKWSVAEAEWERSNHGKRGLFRESYAFRCLAPMIEWDKEGGASKIAAMPLTLGFHDDMKTKGFPRPGNEEDTAALFETLKMTCAAYGTKVELGDDNIFVFTKA